MLLLLKAPPQVLQLHKQILPKQKWKQYYDH